MSSIGDKIKKIRKEKNISQRKLNELSGVSHTQIAKYETNKTIPLFETVEKIAKALDVPIEYFYSSENSSSLNNKILLSGEKAIIEQRELSNIIRIIESMGYKVGIHDNQYFDDDNMLMVDTGTKVLNVYDTELKEIEKESDDYFKFKLQELLKQKM